MYCSEVAHVLPGAANSFVVTAIDGAGGETVASNTISGGIPATLTWNVVPNAIGYNVYENGLLLFGSGLPVPQPALGTLTASYSVTGSELIGLSLPITSINFNSVQDLTKTLGISRYQYTVLLASPLNVTLTLPQRFVVTGNSNTNLNGTFTAISQPTSSTLIVQIDHTGPPNASFEVNGTGGTGTVQPAPPATDTTQPTVLYRMPTLVGSPAVVPVSYNASNIVAYYPADPFVPNPLLTPPPFSPRTPPSTTPFFVPVPSGGAGAGPGGGRGGSGGGGASGGTGVGGATGGSTVSGGVPGNLSFIPQFKQFTNRAIMALGNGYPPQIYSDLATPVNPATITNISSITVDAYGVVTVVTTAANGAIAGGNMLIAGVSDPIFNGAFPVIQVVSPTSFKVQNTAAIGHTGTGGSISTSSLPLQSTFVPSFPPWTANTQLVVGDIIVPVTQPTPAIYLTVTQAGTTGTTEPTPWPTTIGQTKTDNPPSPAGPATVVYTVTGLLVGGAGSPAPPPPGAGHIEVYAGALWVWNTAPSNTSNGLDGPCSVRMSNINNPNSWNPVNQAFLDKDDGQEGMGLAKFTITALGIPPEGSLIAFKDYESYQIIGVFGAANFGIQPVSTDMGCIAPRTIDFVPGYGIMRYSHLGFAVFNGVKDEVMSEQIRPYLFPTDDQIFSDITVIDANWMPVGWGAQTANPPMYCVASPIGFTNGQLTRLFCFDLVLKAWVIVDLPFPISTMSQFRGQATNPITIFGGYQDALISRWQAGDQVWLQNATAPPANNYASYVDDFVSNSGALTTLTISAAATQSDWGLYIRQSDPLKTLTGVDTPPPGFTGIANMTSGVVSYGAYGLVPSGVVTGQTVCTFTAADPSFRALAGLLVLLPTTAPPAFTNVTAGPSGVLTGGATMGGGTAVITSGQVAFIVIQGGPQLLNVAYITDNHFNTWLPFPVPSFSQFSGTDTAYHGASVQLFICPNPVPATNYTFTMQTSPPSGTIVTNGISSCIAATNIVVPTSISEAVNVKWSFQSLTIASGDTDQRVYNRRLVFTAINAGLSGNVTVSYRRDRVVLGTRSFFVTGTANFDLDIATGFTGKQFDAIISGNCNPTINGITWEVEPRPAGVVVGI
jgi:hypothetical protein